MHRALRLAILVAVVFGPGCFGTLDPEAFDVPPSADHGDAADGEDGDADVAADGEGESAVDVLGEAGD
jgi:hypothetical protein